MDYDYGNCHVCGAAIEERLTDQNLRDGADWVLVRNVPTGVCTRCGEQILRWNVSQRLEHIVLRRRATTPIESLQVPVFPY